MLKQLNSTGRTLCLSAALAAGLSAMSAATTTAGPLTFTLDEATKTASVACNDKNLVAADIPATVSAYGADYTVTSIDAWTFYNCPSLTSVTIPPTIATIGSFAFASCPVLERVNISDIAAWCAIEFGNGFSNPLMAGHNIYIDGEKIEHLTVPEGVASLPASCFNGASFTTVSLPASLTEIGDLAFYECTALTAIDIPDAVQTVGTSAFDGCTALAAAELPAGLQVISPYTFNNCSALTAIGIPAAVTEIGTDAFAGCTALTTVDIADVGAWCRIAMANDNANPLKTATELLLDGSPLTELEVPAGVTEIPGYRFMTCPGITSLSLPGSLTTIGENAFEGCTGLTAVEIPAAVTFLGEYAFYDCSAITSATLPAGITAIGNGTFGECTSLTAITVPEGVESIAFGAFFECTSLASASLPSTLKSLGKSAFYGCTALEELTVHAATPPTAKSSTFTVYTATLRVPAESRALYSATEPWSKFAAIETIGSGVDVPVAGDAGREYYDLEGRPAGTAPTEPGIYVGRGGKIIVK